MCIENQALGEEGCSLILQYIIGTQRLTVQSTDPLVPRQDLGVIISALHHPLWEG